MSKPNKLKSFTLYITLIALGVTLGSTFQCGGDTEQKVKYITDYLTDTVGVPIPGPIRYTHSIQLRRDTVPVYLPLTQTMHDTVQITPETALNAHYATDTSTVGLRIEDSIYVFANAVVALTRGIQLDTSRWYVEGFRNGVLTVKCEPARQMYLGIDMGALVLNRSLVFKSGLDFSNNRGWGVSAGYAWGAGPYAEVRVPVKKWKK